MVCKFQCYMICSFSKTSHCLVPDDDFGGGGFDPSMLSGLGGGAGGSPDFASVRA